MPAGSPLISALKLAAILRAAAQPPALLDVRFDLAAAAPRRDDYERAHIPGAVFVDLDADLAGPPGAGGRHPLPDPARFTETMQAAGVRRATGVVVYDARTSMAAARAWWLLRYFGHPDVRVLDGGLSAWAEAGGELEQGQSPRLRGDFVARPGSMPMLDAASAAALAPAGVLVDARSAERFRGESHPLDAVAGHIPAAVNRPTSANVDETGRFLEAEQLRAAFAELGVDDERPLGAYCGSGVTAAHEVLALELAGHRAALYVGSWSEWIRDPARPVER